jgi:hypothetical protein
LLGSSRPVSKSSQKRPGHVEVASLDVVAESVVVPESGGVALELSVAVESTARSPPSASTLSIAPSFTAPVLLGTGMVLPLAGMFDAPEVATVPLSGGAALLQPAADHTHATSSQPRAWFLLN